MNERIKSFQNFFKIYKVHCYIYPVSEVSYCAVKFSFEVQILELLQFISQFHIIFLHLLKHAERFKYLKYALKSNVFWFRFYFSRTEISFKFFQST